MDYHAGSEGTAHASMSHEVFVFWFLGFLFFFFEKMKSTERAVCVVLFFK